MRYLEPLRNCHVAATVHDVLNEELHASSTINSSGHRPSDHCLGFQFLKEPKRNLTIESSSPATTLHETHDKSFVLLIHRGEIRSCENFVVVDTIESEMLAHSNMENNNTPRCNI